MFLILSTDFPCGVDAVQGWLEYNQIPFQRAQLWNQQSRRYEFSQHIDHSVLVCNHMLFQDYLSSPSCMDQLIDFCAKENHIWILGKDSALSLASLDRNQRKNLRRLDHAIAPKRIWYLLDAHPTDGFWIRCLRNITFQILETNFWFGHPRIQAHTLTKTQPRHDFLLTMIQKKSRPHRDVLWQQINHRPDMMRRGLISFRTRCDPPDDVKNWVGRLPTSHGWYDGHASMDLYLDSCVEIVPETCYRDLHYFTEKTQKPIATKTPFLMVTTMGYLGYLKKLGFQTFHSLINEDYDQQPRTEDRIRCMLDVLQHISRNGAFDFYKSSTAILDHNFSRLCELAGGWQYHFDQQMWQLFDQTQAGLK